MAETQRGAIYGTRPWRLAQIIADDGTPVRFAQKGRDVFVLLLSKPKTTRLRIPVDFSPIAEVRLLFPDNALCWKQKMGQLDVELPAYMADSEAYTLKLTLL